MAVDSTGLRSRRALLAGALGAVGSAAVATIAGAQRVLGAGSDGEPVVIGGDYPDVRSTTTFRSSLVSGSGDPGLRFLAEAADGSHNRQATISPAAITLRAENIVSGGRGTTIGADGVEVLGGKWGGTGVSVSTQDGPAIVGRSSQDVGVLGEGGEIGVKGVGGTGVRGMGGSGRGGAFSGGKAQVRLIPSKARSHPDSGAPADLFVDNHKRLWFCRGASDWVRLG